MRAVYLSEDDVDKFKHISEFLRNQGAEKAAGFVSSLILSWQLAEELEPPHFECEVDDRGHGPKLYPLYGHPESLRVDP